ncbi:hypothetical protein TorRG33x02_201660 [Trema orientale]|uniref:Uncharacterized protein n=1 Tax=Trema orientale TaxID=63057 RepID=A0A2P5EEV3_TREOI|nr:hypothetical protein TorRG33x02_201660 [Trema orientale]
MMWRLVRSRILMMAQKRKNIWRVILEHYLSFSALV